MDEGLGKNPLWEWIRKYYLLPATLLWLGMLVIILVINKVGSDADPIRGIHGQWEWNDSTIFEFQKISLRFQADSFFMMHRFMDPKDPKARLPCSQPDYQMYVSGKYVLEADTLIRFDGRFTDSLFSRDTIRLCRDTEFRSRGQMVWDRDRLCLKGEAFSRMVCFTRDLDLTAAKRGPERWE